MDKIDTDIDGEENLHLHIATLAQVVTLPVGLIHGGRGGAGLYASR
jgi:hypothetical protein